MNEIDNQGETTALFQLQLRPLFSDTLCFEVVINRFFFYRIDVKLKEYETHSTRTLALNFK
ncbi:hypothetical protein T01_1858 [Trichinella spiralis]|uniref:Uncharacterized protein n=1 Tax=Trichinella spiralis TaxID=6334 RepID=A0A0V1BFF9_TRISP|nr:hypothetical protein T01_1858 [Trichinella spiralis]